MTLPAPRMNANKSSFDAWEEAMLDDAISVFISSKILQKTIEVSYNNCL
jgi:hypothetical protein